MTRDRRTAPQPLIAHLASGWGQRPPLAPSHVAGTPRRLERSCHAHVHPGRGLRDPEHGAGLPVAPAAAQALRHRRGEGDLREVLACLPRLLALPGHGSDEAESRGTSAPGRRPPPAPGWTLTRQGYRRGCDPSANRSSWPPTATVSTVPGWRSREMTATRSPRSPHRRPARDLVRCLIAQTARRGRDQGAVPTSLHSLPEVASARAAKAAGFPDRGWAPLGITEAPREAHDSPRASQPGTRTRGAPGAPGSRRPAPRRP